MPPSSALRALCERGLTILVTEQFQRFEAQYSDRWLVLERGTVVAAGGKDDVHVLFSVVAGDGQQG